MQLEMPHWELSNRGRASMHTMHTIRLLSSDRSDQQERLLLVSFLAVASEILINQACKMLTKV
jgi:hypothetical protein